MNLLNHLLTELFPHCSVQLLRMVILRLSIALLLLLIPTFVTANHPVDRRLNDLIALTDDADGADDFVVIGHISDLMTTMLSAGGLGDDEPPTDQELEGMVAILILKDPRLAPIADALICLFKSIVLEPIQYVPLPARAEYDDNTVCLDDSCGGGIKEIKFVESKAKKNEFLYGNDGLPPQLRGVHWLNYGGPCSTMVSFAETNENVPIATGRLFPGALPFGFSYYIRVLGASNWAYSTGPDDLFSCYNLVPTVDLIYGFRILEGTVENPTRMQVVPNIKLPFTCIRANIDTCGSDQVLLQFDMALVDNYGLNGGCDSIMPEDDPDGVAKTACEAGITVWRRETWFLADKTQDDPSIYYITQIVDEHGDKLATYDEFVAQETSTEGNAVNHFRSLDDKVEEKFCGCTYTSDINLKTGKSSKTDGGSNRRNTRARGRRAY